MSALMAQDFSRQLAIALQHMHGRSSLPCLCRNVSPCHFAVVSAATLPYPWLSLLQ